MDELTYKLWVQGAVIACAVIAVMALLLLLFA